MSDIVEIIEFISSHVNRLFEDNNYKNQDVFDALVVYSCRNQWIEINSIEEDFFGGWWTYRDDDNILPTRDNGDDIDVGDVVINGCHDQAVYFVMSENE